MSAEVSRVRNFVNDRNNTIPITASYMDAELDQVVTALNQKVVIKSTAPSSPVAGMFWLDSTNKLLKERRNNEWVIHGMVHIGTTAPATLQEGDLWYNTTTDLLKTYNGSAWTEGAIMFPASTALGDILYLSAANTIARLGGNTAASIKYLSQTGNGSVSAAPAWATITPYSVDRQAFTASGTWTKPSSGTTVLIQCWGAGASGGRSNNASVPGGGGGGGSYVERWMAYADISGNQTVTIGAGGAAVTSGATNGNAGANTTFGAHVTAYGGGAGASGGGGGGGAGDRAVGANASSGNGAAGGSPGGGAGATASSAPGVRGDWQASGAGGGFSSGGAASAGGEAWAGGGGGGGGGNSSGIAAAGGASRWGGAGGGGGGENTAGGTAGDSLYGGDGGTGGRNGVAATAGSQPGGGGGGSSNANSGAGGDGMCIVTTW